MQDKILNEHGKWRLAVAFLMDGGGIKDMLLHPLPLDVMFGVGGVSLCG